MVFNAQRVTFNAASPLLITEVTYADVLQREKQLRDHLDVWAQIDGQEPVDEYSTGSLTNLAEFIILGPTVSSPLAKASFIRMLTSIHMQQFADRVFPSTPTSH